MEIWTNGPVVPIVSGMASLTSSLCLTTTGCHVQATLDHVQPVLVSRIAKPFQCSLDQLIKALMTAPTASRKFRNS
ncbi:hypothetical protein M514_09127 [Trichuris suis]|uniref:Uncharacterized protein n=1 Tax=Trichuris suis TaxID=68888 RepID=A0A085N5L8_9BILA|nr:hypothetical protein M513_09127 [Trichuris suis]KFD64764.1 hypothetical protein M514_09127 [Trichuris suis]